MPTKKKSPKKKSVAKAKKRPAKNRSAKKTARAAHVGVARVLQSPHIATHAWRRNHYTTLAEFWPFYLHEHAHAANRRLHFIGSSLGIVLVGIAIGAAQYWLLLAALVSGYAFAWVGHFFIEKNRPATFKYPLKSFISDWRMWYTILTGKIDAELAKFGIASK